MQGCVMREHVILKGSRAGLQLVLNESADFSEILAQLKAKLEAAAGFFTMNMLVQVPEHKTMTPEQREQLVHLLAGYGLDYQDSEAVAPAEDALSLMSEDTNVSEKLASQPREVVKVMHDLPLAQPPACQEVETLFVDRTVRGGQKITYNGSVVITGDVNPGSAVVAAGNILIKGICRGVVHAGAYGQLAATITAGRMRAAQIRIAGMIARSPDVPEEVDYPETARLSDDGAVMIEPAQAKEEDLNLWVR